MPHPFEAGAGLDAQSAQLLVEYDAMKAAWAPRIAEAGIVEYRAFADEVFARFRGPKRDVAPAETLDLLLPGGGGPRSGRLYRAHGRGPAPVALYLHGGGWSLGGIAAYDGLAGSLAALSGVSILSLDYRLAPEHPFPAALDDCMAALAFFAAEGASFGCDPARLGVVGDSAGGNLAAVAAREAALAGGPRLRAQLLIYPMTDIASAHAAYASRLLYGDGRLFLANDGIAFARDNYAAAAANLADPRISPLLGPVPAGIAPAFILTAGRDPLRDEGHAYHAKLVQAGAPSSYHCTDETIHAFLSFGVLDCAQQARRTVAAALRTMLGGG